jgi:hypothetical protein
MNRLTKLTEELYIFKLNEKLIGYRRKDTPHTKTVNHENRRFFYLLQAYLCEYVNYIQPCSPLSATGRYTEPVEFRPHSHSISLRLIPIFKLHPCLGLPSGLLCWKFRTKILCAVLISHTRLMPLTSHHPWFFHPNNIYWGLHFMTILVVQSCHSYSYFLPLRWLSSGL